MTNIRDEDLLSQFGAHLARTRRRLKISQRELAYAADIPISQVSRIERGLVNPSLSTLNAIATSLNISLADLLTF